MLMTDNAEPAETFGSRLAASRREADLTRDDLAARMGVGAGTVARWESGKSAPRSNRIQMLAGMMNVSIVWLMTGAAEDTPAATLSMDAIVSEMRDLAAAQARIASRMVELETLLRQASDGA